MFNKKVPEIQFCVIARSPAEGGVMVCSSSVIARSPAEGGTTKQSPVINEIASLPAGAWTFLNGAGTVVKSVYAGDRA